MAKILEEINVDARFIRSHTLQPAWYKFMKIFILLGGLAAYWWFWGLTRMLVFLLGFLLFSLLLHLAYRAGTHKFQESWLDFKVIKVNGRSKTKSIGVFYYVAIVVNAVIAALISFWLV